MKDIAAKAQLLKEFPELKGGFDGLMEDAYTILASQIGTRYKLSEEDEEQLRTNLPIKRSNSEDTQEEYGVNVGNTLGKWILGEPLNGRKDKNLLKVLFMLKIKYNIIITADEFLDLNKYQLGHSLGFDWREVQEYSDSIFARPRPNVGHLLDYKTAHTVLDRFEGIYDIYYLGVDNHIVRSSLRVRYYIKQVKSVGFIRCKLHMFNTEEKDDYYRYNGYLVQKDSGIYFFFEEENKSKVTPDITTITCHPNESERNILRGLICSISHKKEVYSSPVYMLNKQRDVSKIDNHSEVIKLMYDDMDIFKDDSLVDNEIRLFLRDIGRIVVPTV